MGVSITEDEQDKKIRQAREVRQQIVKDHAHDTNAHAELMAKDGIINRTKLYSKKKLKENRSNIDPDPSHAYRWVNRTKDGEIISLRQGMGYEIVADDDDTQAVMHSKIDGTQVQGHMVLMRTSVENYERHVKARRARWQQMSGDRTEAAKENINRTAREAGLVGAHKDAIVE